MIKGIKPQLEKEFKKFISINTDEYGRYCVKTVTFVCEKLADLRRTPKSVWESAMKKFNNHSGYSAAICCQCVIFYSSRGKEFKAWAKTSGQFTMCNFSEVKE